MRNLQAPLFLILFFIGANGCKISREFNYVAKETSTFHNKKIVSVTLLTGESLRYDNAGGRYYEEKKDTGIVKKIVGFDRADQPLNVDLNRILEVKCQVSENNDVGTAFVVLLSIGIGILVLGILIFSRRSVVVY